MIDMQRGFLDEASSLCIKMAGDTVPACAELIDHCHKERIPVFFVTRRYRADGSDVEHSRYKTWLAGGRPLSELCPETADYPKEFTVLPEDRHIIKPRFSAFFQTELDMMLRRLKVDTVILAGTTTPNCIRTTMYDAISLEYNATEDIQRANLLDMSNIGGHVMSLEEFKAGKPWENTVELLSRPCN